MTHTLPTPAHASRLVAFIRSHPTFRVLTSMEGCYGHMGATLADAVLQAGVNYKTVVRPRVDALRTNFPAAARTSGFLALLTAPEGAVTLLNWRGAQKIATLLELTTLLAAEHVEAEADLRVWIMVPSNFDRLWRIKGLKDKTASYLKILLGLPNVAMDRHLFAFLAEAGVRVTAHEEGASLVRAAAARLGVEPSLLDHSIWRYMSERATTG